MKTRLWLGAASVVAACVVVAGVAGAEAPVPDDVVYSEYGEIMESLTGVAGDPVRGAELMTTRSLGNCIACHQVTALESEAFHGEVGPSLDGAVDRWSTEQLRGIVANAKMTFPESIMPAFYKTSGFIRPGDAYTGKAPTSDLPPILSAQDIEDVVAYLSTLHDE